MFVCVTFVPFQVRLGQTNQAVLVSRVFFQAFTVVVDRSIEQTRHIHRGVRANVKWDSWQTSGPFPR